MYSLNNSQNKLFFLKPKNNWVYIVKTYIHTYIYKTNVNDLNSYQIHEFWVIYTLLKSSNVVFNEALHALMDILTLCWC